MEAILLELVKTSPIVILMLLALRWLNADREKTLTAFNQATNATVALMTTERAACETRFNDVVLRLRVLEDEHRQALAKQLTANSESMAGLVRLGERLADQYDIGSGKHGTRHT